MNGATLHDPLAASTVTPTTSNDVIMTNGGGSGPTIQSEATRLTTLKDNITIKLDVYFSVLKTVSRSLYFRLESRFID